MGVPDLMTTQLATVLLLADFITSLIFCITYHVTASWWKHPFGVSLMLYQLLMTAVMGFTAWRVMTGTPLPLPVGAVRLVLFAVIPVTLAWRTVVMIRVQRREKETAPSEPSDPV
jgi:hypothetical protein